MGSGASQLLTACACSRPAPASVDAEPCLDDALGRKQSRLMIHQQDEGSSSSVTSSPLQNFSNMPLNPSPGAGATLPWMLRELRSDERGLCLIHLLLNCAAAGRLDAANAALEHIATLASPDGDAMQRVAAAFAEALARHALRAWPGLCRALLLPRASPTPAEVAVPRRHFLDLCPFQFNPVVTRLDALDVESLRVKTGEALAITSSLQLHRLLATSPQTTTRPPPTRTSTASSSQTSTASFCTSSVGSSTRTPSTRTAAGASVAGERRRSTGRPGTSSSSPWFGVACCGFVWRDLCRPAGDTPRRKRTADVFRVRG